MTDTAHGVRKLKAFTRRNGKMRPGEKLFIRAQHQRHASELWAVLCRPCEAPAHEHPAAGIVQLIMLQRCVLFLRAFILKNRIPRKTAAPQALQAFPVHTKGRAVARTERIFRHAQLSLSACQLGAVAFRQQPPLFREGAYCLRLRAGQNVQHDPFSAEIDGRDADHSAVPICRPIHAQLLTGSSLLPPEAAVKANAPGRGFAMFSLRHLCTFFQFSV